MSNAVRIALPGYNALTDTNLDHFSLYSDVDNVLIKRLTTGTATIADGNPTIQTIAHNLGYIPFFVVYADNNNNGKWEIVNNQYNSFSVPQIIAAADTTNLYIYNFGGHASGNVKVAYDIFYDNMNDNTAPNITESKSLFKVARPGKSAFSLNPNDYIMHSDLNSFKILKEGSINTNIANTSSYSFAHGLTLTTPYKAMVFVYDHNDSAKFFFPLGNATIKRVNLGTTYFDFTIDSTNITIDFPSQGSTADTITIKYYIFGTGVTGFIDNTGNTLSVAKSGINVLNSTNPEDFNFHSKLGTLKYFTSNSYSMTVSDNTTHTIPHNLGYTPFFIVFVGDLAGIISGGYALLPYYYSRSNISTPNKDVAAWAYADDTNIYLKAYFQSSAIGTSFTFNFYYKIFKNKIG